MTATRELLIDDYLARLDAALGDLPRDRRREIVDEVAEHIAAGSAELAPGDEAGLRTLLDRLGDPGQIAADAQVDEPPRRKGLGPLELGAILLLLVGGFFAGVGWVVGVVFLWISDRWTRRDKLIGTLIVPGGLALPVVLALFGGGTSYSTGCSGVTRNSASGGVVTTAEHCTTSGGPALWEQIAWPTLIVALLLASGASAVYLGRRSR